MLLLLLCQAARRTEKRRLSAFIRLLDYMVADCVHSMIVASLRHAQQCLHGHSTAAAAGEQEAGHEVGRMMVESAVDMLSGCLSHRCMYA
jgi:hypothetical protein